MVRLTKIYTRTGDDGTTALVGGSRVPKDDLRIDAYGTVDELNACLGLVRTALAGGADEAERGLDATLAQVQQDLFNLGSSLATPHDQRWEGQPVIADADVTRLEQRLDALNADLPKLKSFVLPGGGPVGAHLHLARTVCRRAERCVVGLARQVQVEPADVRYLNRLSDLLFVMSRWAAAHRGGPEVLWMP